MPTTGYTVCAQAALELGVLDPIETLTAADAAFLLTKVNRLIDNWNAERDAVYADVWTTFTATPSLTPHTIGPTGTWVVPQRPVSIEAASLILAPTMRQHIRLQSANWWNAQPLPTFTSSTPTDLYYNPTWPNGTLNFWGIPTAASSIELRMRVVLADLTLATVFSLPPGYEDAVILTLAEDAAAGLGTQASPKTMQRAQEARERIFANNRTTPTLTTRDSGMPGGRGSGYNYRTGGY